MKMNKWLMVVCVSVLFGSGSLMGCETMKAAGTKVGDQKQGMVSKLIGMLSSESKDKKETAMTKLVALGKRALPPLINALKTGGKETKKGALETMGRMGTKAEPAKAEVQKATQSSDPGIKQAAMSALAKITGKK